MDQRETTSVQPSARSGRYIGGLIGAFRPFVTSRLRENSNEILTGEILFAVRRGLPIDDVLEASCIQTKRIPATAWNWTLFGLVFLVAGIIALFGLIGGILLSLVGAFLLLMAFGGMTQSDQYRQHVAITLCHDLRRGRGLGEALGRHPALFSRFEATLMRAGERSGKLASALAAWQRHAKSAEKTGHTADMIIYPAVVFMATTCMMLFIARMIWPRYNDFFSQVSNPITQSALGSFMDLFLDSRITMLFLLVAATFLFAVLPRRFFNGNVQGSFIYIFLVFFGYMVILWMCLAAFWGSDWDMSNGGDVGYALPIMALLSSGLSAGVFLLGRWVAGPGTERIVGLLSFLPWLRGAERRLAESRFLFALGVLLEGGEGWPEALAEAGRAVGRRKWSRAGEAAAARARQGRPPHEVIALLNLLYPETRARLSTAEFAGQWPEAFLDAAETSHRIGSMSLGRFNTLFFPIIHILVCFMIGSMIVGVYAPLFFMSNLVTYSIL